MNHYLEVKSGLESKSSSQGVGRFGLSFSQKMPAKRKVTDSKAEDADVQSRTKSVRVDSKAAIKAVQSHSKAVSTVITGANVLLIELTLNHILVYADPVTVNRILQANRYLRADGTKKLWARLAELWQTQPQHWFTYDHASIHEAVQRRVFNAPNPSPWTKLSVLRTWVYGERVKQLNEILTFLHAHQRVSMLWRVHLTYDFKHMRVKWFTPHLSECVTYTVCLKSGQYAFQHSDRPMVDSLTQTEFRNSVITQFHTIRRCSFTVLFTEHARVQNITVFRRRFPSLRKIHTHNGDVVEEAFYFHIPHLDAPDVLSLKA